MRAEEAIVLLLNFLLPVFSQASEVVFLEIGQNCILQLLEKHLVHAVIKEGGGEEIRLVTVNQQARQK